MSTPIGLHGAPPTASARSSPRAQDAARVGVDGRTQAHRRGQAAQGTALGPTMGASADTLCHALATRSTASPAAPVLVSPEPATLMLIFPATLPTVQSPQPALESSRLAVLPTEPNTAPPASTLASLGIRTTIWGMSS